MIPLLLRFFLIVLLGLCSVAPGRSAPKRVYASQDALVTGSAKRVRLAPPQEQQLTVELAPGRYDLYVQAKPVKGQVGTITFKVSLESKNGQVVETLGFAERTAAATERTSLTITEPFRGILRILADRDCDPVELTVGINSETPALSTVPPLSPTRPRLIVLIHGICSSPDEAGETQAVATHRHPRYYWGYDFVHGLLGASPETSLRWYQPSRQDAPDTSISPPQEIARTQWSPEFRPPGSQDDLASLFVSSDKTLANAQTSVLITYRDGSKHVLQQTKDTIRQIKDTYDRVYGTLPDDKKPMLCLVAHSFGGVVSRTIFANPNQAGLFPNDPALDPQTRADADFLRSQTLWLATLSTPHLGSPASDIGPDLDAWAKNKFAAKQDLITEELFPASSDAPLRRALRLVLGEIFNQYIVSQIDGDRDCLQDIQRQQEINQTLLAAGAKRPDGSLIPIYTMAGRDPGNGYFDRFAGLIPEAVAINLFPTGRDPNAPRFDRVTFLKSDVSGLGFPGDANSVLVERGGKEAVGLLATDLIKHRLGYGKEPGRPWGSATVSEGDRFQSPQIANLPKVVRPVSESAGPTTEQLKDVASAVIWGRGYPVAPDGQYDSDGFVGFDSSHGLGIPGTNWYRLYTSGYGTLHPWDFDNHGSLTFNPGTAQWLRYNLIERAGPTVQGGAFSVWTGKPAHQNISRVLNVRLQSVRALSSGLDISGTPKLAVTIRVAEQLSQSWETPTEVVFRAEGLRGTVVPLVLSVVERDNGGLEGDDDACVLSPRQGRDSAYVWVDLAQRKIYGLSDSPTNFDTPLTVRGYDGAKNRVELQFTLSDGLSPAGIALLPPQTTPAQSGGRPTEGITVITGEHLIISLENVTYDAATSPDPNAPASGTANLALRTRNLKIGDANLPEQTVRQERVRFQNLVIQGQRVVGGGITLASELALPGFLTPELGFTLAQGGVFSVSTGVGESVPSLRFSGSARLTLPIRDSEGQSQVVSLSGLTISTDPTTTTLRIEQLSVPAGLAPLALAGSKLRLTQPLRLEVTAVKDRETRWKLTAPEAEAQLALPDLTAKESSPLALKATNVIIDSEEGLSLTGTLLAPKTFTLAQPADFSLTVRSATVTLTKDELTNYTLTGSLSLPRTVTDVKGNPIVLDNLTLSKQDGMLLVRSTPLDAYWQGMALHTKTFTLDLSRTRSAAPLTGRPEWQGLYIAEGQLSLPPSLGGTEAVPHRIRVTNFQLESQGITGAVTLQPGGQGEATIPTLAGFDAEGVQGSFSLLRSRVVACELSGKIRIPVTPGGAAALLNTTIGFTDEGLVTLNVAPASGTSFPIAALGLEVAMESGTLQFGVGSEGVPVGKVFVNGQLGFTAASFPDALRQSRVGVRGLGFDSKGNVYLPEGGILALPRTVRVAFGPGAVEVERIGFVAESGKLTGLTLTGGVSLGGDLPIEGDIDFEGLTIRKDGLDTDNLPDLLLGRIALNARVPGVGRLQGDLTYYRKTDSAQLTEPLKSAVNRFGDTFWGAASLELEALQGAGVGVNLLLAENAWFVGGQFLPGVAAAPRIALPPVALYGFYGGFGRGIAPATPGVGRITQLSQIKPQANNWLAQAGLILGDPVAGRVWWGEATLTVGFPALVVDLTGQATFLNLSGPSLQNADWWEEQDHTARIFANLDAGKKTFMMGGKLDFNFPTRQSAILTAGGEFAFKLSDKERYLRIGWTDAGQTPVFVKINALKAANVRAEGGLALNMIEPYSGSMFLNIHAGFLDNRVRASLETSLTVEQRQVRQLNGVPVYALSARGEARLMGTVDFTIFEASASAVLGAQYNTVQHPDALYLYGGITGSARVPFLGRLNKTFDFDLEIKK